MSELIIVSGPTGAEWELRLPAGTTADSFDLLEAVVKHLTPDTPIPGRYGVYGDHGHIDDLAWHDPDDVTWAPRAAKFTDPCDPRGCCDAGHACDVHAPLHGRPA